MNKKERVEYVLGLLIEAIKNTHTSEVFTCYLQDKEIFMNENCFTQIFSDYKREPHSEEWNRFITMVDGVKIYTLTKEGIKPDDF